MRFEGKLEKWNDDRGFGFITPTRGGEPVFVHISAFPRGGRRPRVGEALTFDVESAGDGKKRAIQIERSSTSAPGRHRPGAGASAARRPRSGENLRAFLYTVGAVLLLAVGAAVSFGRFGAKQSGIVYRCDGRTHCSQMTSCEEAKFFLRNCPGTTMDGDGDGVPCEKQWCTGLFWR